MNKHGLDATDIRILSVLQECGRLSKTALSEQVNLSPNPCWMRFKKLEKAGFIKAYRAEIAIDKILAPTKVVVTVSLKNHRKPDFDIFETYIQSIDQIVQCVATGGGFDYILTLVCSSLASFQELMDRMVEDEIGIDRYITYFVTREIKSSRPNLLELSS